MFPLVSLFIFLPLLVQGFQIKSSRNNDFIGKLKMSAEVGASVPEGIKVDILSSPDGKVYYTYQAEDLGALLKSNEKAVLFALPGAFTPTCSAQHLPGFVANAAALKAKGVDAIYCLSVNDRFVMQSWAEAIPGCITSGITIVADGNGELTQALGLSKDATGSRMGIRSKRYAAILEYGKFIFLNVDEKGLDTSAAEEVLNAL